MKNSFYFILKALFLLGIYPDFLNMLKNCLIGKLRLISKFITSHTGQQIITIHTLPNISRSKGNQARKFCQLIEYKIRNVFLEKQYAKCGSRESRTHLYINLKLGIPHDQQS